MLAQLFAQRPFGAVRRLVWEDWCTIIRLLLLETLPQSSENIRLRKVITGLLKNNISMIYLSVMFLKQWVIPSVFKNCNKVLVCRTAIRTLNFWKTLMRANIIWFQWIANEADLVCPGLPKWFMQGHFSLNRNYHPVNFLKDCHVTDSADFQL